MDILTNGEIDYDKLKAYYKKQTNRDIEKIDIKQLEEEANKKEILSDRNNAIAKRQDENDIKLIKEFSKADNGKENIKIIARDNPKLAIKFFKSYFEDEEVLKNQKDEDYEIYFGIIEGIAMSTRKQDGFNSLKKDDQFDFISKAIKFQSSGKPIKSLDVGKTMRTLYQLNPELFREISPQAFRKNVRSIITTEYRSVEDVVEDVPEIMFVMGSRSISHKFLEAGKIRDKIFDNLKRRPNSIQTILEYKPEFTSFIKTCVRCSKYEELEGVVDNFRELLPDDEASKEIMDSMLEEVNQSNVSNDLRDRYMKFINLNSEKRKTLKQVKVEEIIEKINEGHESDLVKKAPKSSPAQGEAFGSR